MKKIIMLTLVVSLLLTGCRNINTTNTNTVNSSTETEMPESTVPTYSAEEDAAAAEYLVSEYGIDLGETAPKVILDCDMSYLYDDAMCMCILVQADTLGLVDLLGVTITGGNQFVSYGTNSALVQLERIERADIPVYMGTDIPINGIRDLEAQAEIIGQIDRYGSMHHFDEYVAPEKYHDLGSFYDRKWGYSETEPQEQSSVDFMIEQVNKYKGEVTIISVGAATNVAMACEKDSSFAANTAGIIYMGTIIEGAGTYTPYADFNVFYDAEAFDFCLKSAFPSQTVIPHDAAETAVLNKAVFDLMDEKNDTLISNLWLDNWYSQYRRNTHYKSSCTDAIAAVVLLNPHVIQDERMLSLEINTDVNSPEYGHTICDENGDVKVVMSVNTEVYWNFVTDLICHMQDESEFDYAYFVDANT